MNWKRFVVVAFALLAAFSLATWRTPAQTATTGDVAGVVTDPSNAVVPDAKLTLKDNVKGSTQETKSNKDGAFRFYLLAPSSYTLTVTATGFQTVSRPVSVVLAQVVTADVQLTLGSASQTVTVTESAPLIQTENGDTGRALSQQQVANVPNPGNDLSAIAQLAPGAIMNTQGGFGNVEAFGLPATSNLFTFNGMDDNDPFLNLNNSGASNLLLGTNEVQEADVVTNAYSGSFGTFSGVQVNYITKSGGNEFHGNAVYYWNGRIMNANDWIHNDAGSPRPFDNANQWAASFGGPIKKDKLFFFLNTEGLRVLIPVPSAVFVPTTDFEVATLQNLTATGLTKSIPFYCQNITLTSAVFGSFTCPAGVPGAGSGMFNIFNGAKNSSTATPQGCFNVLKKNPALATAGLTNCVNEILETPVNFAPEKQIAGRADWNISSNDRAYLRMQYDQGVQPTFTDPLTSLFNTSSNQPEYQGQLNETHVFSPTLSNQFLVASTWYSAIFKAPNQAATLAAFPTTLLLLDGSLDNLSAGTALGGIGFAFPQGRNVTQFQVNDDISKTIGNHTIKIGAKYHRNFVSDHDFGNRVSGLEFVNTLNDFYNGAGDFLEQNFTSARDEPIRLYEVAGYIQDDWRIRPNLTISPALRLEHASNPICVTLCFAQLSEPLAELTANSTQPYNQIIASNQRNALLSYPDIQPEPRISFAWQPFSNATSYWKKDVVVRGGAGIFYDIFPGVVADSVAQNAPLFNPFVVASGAAGCSGFIATSQPGNLFSCASAANNAFVTAFNTGANAVAAVPGIFVTQPKTKAPEYYKWSLQIQKSFGSNNSIDVGYYGNKSIHIPIPDNSFNAFCDGIPADCGGVPLAAGQLPATPRTTQFAQVTNVVSAGNSNYNGVTASFVHRFAGFGSGILQINYTYSRAMDFISDGGLGFNFNTVAAESQLFPVNPNNISENYGPAEYDARHVINGNYVWEIPVRKALGGHGWAALVDGWQVSGAAFYRTGFPFTVVDGAAGGALNANNYFGQIFPEINAAVPRNCNSEAFAGVTSVGVSSCFGPASGTASTFFGNNAGGPGSETVLGAKGLRNAFRGPSYFDTDFSFTKKTKIPHWERGEIGVGLQFFNLFNHPNFYLPVNDISSPAFGTIQQSVNPPTSILGSFLGGDAAPRLIQIKAQLTF